jgi:phage/plasmid-associated DNA primase
MQRPNPNDPRLAFLRKEAKPNCLNGITLYETVDLQVLEKLINSNLLKTTFNNKICKVWHDNERQQLEKYRNKMVGNRAKITYRKSKHNPYGRCNPEHGVGLYNIRREIRHTNAAKYYKDVDIDNCHPRILMLILQAAGIDAPLLRSYVENRQEWLDLVNKHYKILQMDIVKEQPHLKKDIPKDLFIRLLYGGGSKPWVSKWGIEVSIANQKLIDFENEIETINEWIAMANPHILEIAEKIKEDDSYNINGTVCSYYLQEFEAQILEIMYLYCVKNGYIKNDNTVLCADGLMIEIQLYKPQLLRELEQEILNKTGFDLKLSNKEMELGYNAILNKSLRFDFNIYSTAFLANIFRVLYMDKYIYVDGKLYEYNGVYWQPQDDKRHTPLHIKIQNSFKKYVCKEVARMIEELTEKANEEGYDIKMAKLNLLMKKVIESCDDNGSRKSLVDDIIYAITFNHIEMDSHENLLAFTNAVYDLHTAQWIEPNPTQYISMTTRWNWNRTGTDHTRLNNFLDQIFPNPKIKDHYLTILATGLWGKQVEKIFNATGAGGNGKGVINALMLSAIGDYGYVLPSNTLVSEIKEGANPAIANMHKKRLVITSEPNAKKTINSSTAKEITGNSTLNCRGLYSSNCVTTLLLTLILECNKQPNFDEVNDAIARRLDVTPFVATFKDKHLYDDATAGKTVQEIKKMNIYESDIYFKSEEFQNENRQALIEMLFVYFEKFKKNGYKFVDIPAECKAASDAYMKKSDNIYNWFTENYEEDKNSVVMIKDTYNAFKESELYINMTKQEKRANNLHNFTEEIKENMFIGKHFKARDTSYKGKQYKSAYIVGFAEKSRGEENTYTNADEDDGFTAEEKK